MVSKMNKTNLKALIGVLQKENQGLKEELELEKGGREHDVQQFQEVLSENQGLKTKIEDLEETLRMKEKYETDQMSEVMGRNMDLAEEIKELKEENENLRRRPHPEYVKELETKVEKLEEEKKKEHDGWYSTIAQNTLENGKLKKENADLLLAIGSKVVSEIINKVEKEDEKSTELENLMEYKNSYEEHQHMLAFIAGNYKNGTYVEAILCKYYDKEFIENSEEVWDSFGLFTDVEGGGWEKYWETPNECLNTVPDERLVPIANGELTRLQEEVKELTTYKEEVTDSIQQAVARVLDLEAYY